MRCSVGSWPTSRESSVIDPRSAGPVVLSGQAYFMRGRILGRMADGRILIRPLDNEIFSAIDISDPARIRVIDLGLEGPDPGAVTNIAVAGGDYIYELYNLGHQLRVLRVH